MATYEITGPDGSVYEITAPDDADESQVLEYAKSQFAGGVKEPQQADSRGIAGRTFDLAKEAAMNAPRSSLNLLNNLGLALMHPFDTAQSLGEIAFGGAQKLIPGEQGNEEAFNRVADFYKNRYGSLESFNQAIAQDPAGVLADMSTLVSGAGGLTKAVGGVTGARGAVTAGQVVSDVGNAANPVNVMREAVTAVPRKIPSAVQGVGAVTERVGQATGIQPVTDAGAKISQAGRSMAAAPENLSVSMMEKTVKPSTTIPQKTRQEILRYMLENKMNATSGGLKRLENKLKANNDLFDNVINEAAKRGEDLDVSAIAKTLDRTRRIFKDDLFADTLLTKVDEVETMLNNHPNVVNGRIPIDKARAMKTRLHEALKGSYGEMSSLMDESLKDIVHGINQEVWNRYPELKAAGQEMRVQIALERELERAVNRLGNNNSISLQDLMVSTAGGPAGVKVAASVGLTNKVLRMPAVKGAIARALYNVNKKKFAERNRGAGKASVRNIAVSGQAARTQGTSEE